MEEPKKISFSTIGPVKTSKKKVKRRRAIRITIKLPESNEKSCPEYNYGELLSQYMAKQKQQQLGSPGRRPPPSTPGPDSDEDDGALQALATSLERKYGNSYNTAGKRKKRRKDSDFNALGEGYDENDSFIDNTGAYDEVLPSNMETKHGGFYINSGELDYRELSDSEEAPENSTITSTPTPSVKRKLRVESDDDEEEASSPQPQQGTDTVTNGPTSGAGGAALDEGELLRKRRKLISKLNAKKSAQQPDPQPSPVVSTNTTATTTTDAIIATTTNMSSVAASIEAVVNKVRNEVSKTSTAAENHAPPVPPSTSAPHAAVCSEAHSPPPPAVDAVLFEAAPVASPPSGTVVGLAPAAAEASGGSDDASNSSSSSSSSSSDDSSTSSDSSSSSDSEEEEDEEAKASAALEAAAPPTQESRDAIESTVVDVVESVATADTASNSMDTQPSALPSAAASAGLTTPATAAAVREGKTLPDNLSPDLLAVIELLKEEGRKAIGCSSSQKFFTDKVKRLVLSIETKLQESGGRNKTQVYQYLSHHVPCGPATLVKRAKQMLQHVNENKVAQPLRNLKDVLDREMPVLMEAFAEECRLAAQQHPELYWDLYYHFWSSDAPPPLSAADDKKKHKMPKKRYNFTPESDSTLQVVVAARVSLWLEGVGKKAGDTPEDYITSFLEQEVRTLWPKGWVTTRQLYRQSAPTHASITSPLGELSTKALVKKAQAVPSFSSVADVPISHPFPKPPPMALAKAAAVASTNKPVVSVSPVDVVAAAKMTDSVGKMSYEDELALKVMQEEQQHQKASQPQHSPEVTHPLLWPDEAAAAVKVAERTRKVAVDVRMPESHANSVLIEREPQSVEIMPQHKMQQLEKITDQLPPALRTELTISYKGANADGGSLSLEITPTKVIEGTNKLNDYCDTSRSSSDAVAVSREQLHSQNGSEHTPLAEKDVQKKPSPISVKSVSSINKMSDVEFAVKTQPSQVKTSLKFADETISLEAGYKKQPTQLAEKQSKVSFKGVDPTVDIRSIKHHSQAALPSAKDAQIIDLSSDEERPERPRVAPVTTAPIPMPAQFSPPPSTALTATPVRRDPFLALRESVPTIRETLSASQESLSYIRDFAPTIKKPVPTVAELTPSLKKPIPTAGELAPSIRKPVPTGGELGTPIKKPIPTVGELAFATKSPSSPGFNDSSNSKLEEEMDDVMNELLQISKKKQQSSPPVSSGPDAVKTSSAPSSQQREKQYRTSSSALMAEPSIKSPSAGASVSVTETLQHKAEKVQRSVPSSAIDVQPQKKKVSPLARLQQEQQQQQLLLQQKLLQQSHQQQDDIIESYKKHQLEKYQDKYKTEQKQPQQKKQKTSHNPTSSLSSGLDAAYYHSSASGLTITSKTVKQPQLSPNLLLPLATSMQPSSALHSSGSNHTPSKSHHHATSVASSNSQYPLNPPYQLSPPSQFSPTHSHSSSNSQRGSNANASYPNSSQHSSLNHGKSSSSLPPKVSHPSKSPRSSNSSAQVSNSHNSINHSISGSSSQRSGSLHHQSSASQGFPSLSHSAASPYNTTKSSAHNNGGSVSLHSSQAHAAHYANALQHSTGSGSGKVPSPQYSPGSSHRSPSSSKHPFSIATLSTSSVKSSSPSDASSRNTSHINSLLSAHGAARSNNTQSKGHSSSAHSNSTHSSGHVGASSSAHRGASIASALHGTALPLAHSIGATPKVPTSSSKESRDGGGSFKHRKTASAASADSPEKESQFGMLTVEQQRELLLKQHQVQQLQQDMWLQQRKQSDAAFGQHNCSIGGSSKGKAAGAAAPHSAVRQVDMFSATRLAAPQHHSSAPAPAHQQPYSKSQQQQQQQQQHMQYQ